MAPLNDDSGKHQGRRSTSGGRREVRTVLYMAAVAAVHHNPVIRDCCQRLRARGKSFKVAMVACMRKRLIILNAMTKHGQAWNPHLRLA